MVHLPADRGSRPQPDVAPICNQECSRGAAYLDHPVLGPRLQECATVVYGISGRTALGIFGAPDDMKLRSSATLFASVSGGGVFEQIIQKYFDGQRDEKTLEKLRSTGV